MAWMLVIVFGWSSTIARASSESTVEFVKQLRSYCVSSEHSSAAYTLEQSPGSKARLTWKCPYKIALRVDGEASMEFIFNGSEAWFFYPARALEPAKAQPLEKVEHYTSLENRVLGLWSDLWREPSRETHDQSRVEELYTLSMKVENRLQVFSFVPKKPEFPSLALGFALDQSIRIPSVISFTAKGSTKYMAKLVPGSAKKISVPGPRTFNPEMPDTKVNLQVPQAPKAVTE